MQDVRRASITCTLALAALLGAVRADADAAGRPAGSSEVHEGEGYSYRFLDDPLAAGGVDLHDTRWMIRVTGYRPMLLRPRVQFIPELLKSVEAL